jgi:hypothetical protein
VLATLGGRLGVVRTQDRWPVQAPADAEKLAGLESRYRPPHATKPLGREAWSTSFRLDPPRVFEPDRPLSPPGAAMLGALLTPLGVADGRVLSLPAYLLLILLSAAVARPEHRPSAVALAALLPFLATGTVFGAPSAVVLAALAACLLALAAGRWGGACALAGLAAALDHRAWLAALPLAAQGRKPGAWTRAGRWLLLGYAAAIGLPLLLDPVHVLAAPLRAGGALGPGVGLANLLIFRGWQDAGWAHAVFALFPAGLALATLVLLRRRWSRPRAIAGAAFLWLLSLFLAREASPEALGVPVVLLGLAALLDEDQRPNTRDESESAARPPELGSDRVELQALNQGPTTGRLPR